MRFSVIIVSYNVRYFLEQALLSVRRATSHLEAEVFVVDNNSTDGSVAMVREKFPEVVLIANTDNPGFAVANNQAIRQASGEYILLLNPDTVVAEDTFEQCLAFMDDHPAAGALGVRMVDGSGTFLPESKRGFPSPWVAFCKAFALSALFPRSRWFNQYHLGYLPEKETHQIEVLAGAFMWMRASVLAEVGLLDEAFFMYGEDIDLSYRIVKGGYHNYYYPGTTIIHYKGESTKKGSLNYVRVFYQAMVIFVRKHFTGSGAALFVGMLQLAVYFRASLTLVSGWLRRLLLPLIDAVLLYGGLVLLLNFWASYRFQDPAYYDASTLWTNFPLYVLIWLISIFFSGGYDRPFVLRRLVRGILVGAILLAAVYGLLPLALRSSRALIVLGTGWALLALPAWRFLLQSLYSRQVLLTDDEPNNLAIIGSPAEQERAVSFLRQVGVRKNYLGTIAPTETSKLPDYLGPLHQLADLVTLYRIDELLFCSRDLRYKTIIYWMDRLGPQLQYKIMPEATEGVIGSHSKNETGQLYTLDARFRIAQAAERRNKRVFDLGLALFVLVSWPLLGWWQQKPWGRLRNGLQVLGGQKTWVAYTTANPTDLPPLRPGILSPLAILPTGTGTARPQRLDYFYAREYSVGRDMAIVWRAWAKLGSS